MVVEGYTPVAGVGGAGKTSRAAINIASARWAGGQHTLVMTEWSSL